MVNENIRKMQLQFMYLGISLFSCFCIMTNFYIITCSNIVGFICLIDFYFVKKKDMLLHHILVLSMLHYMNYHSDIENRKEIVSVILSTETSTIFLTLNNLLENTSSLFNVKKINKLAFVSSFVYYRIYNYSYYLILDKNIHNTFLIYSRNNFEYCEIYIGLYGLFILNLYWCCLIIKKIMFKNNYIKTGENA
jgi:hypothetical protein